MQLPMSGSGPSPHPLPGLSYHGPPPNVMVSASMQHHPGNMPPPHVIPPDMHPGMRPMGPPVGHPVLPNLLESRISEMNKRLHVWITSNVQEKDHAQWWDAFAHEFFDEDAKMTLSFTLEDGPKRYTIGRTLIPRYFRTIFESGVKELYYLLRNPVREIYASTTMGVPIPVLDAENVLIFTKHDKPSFTEVQTEARLICEFVLFEDPILPPRIRSWNVEIHTHQEFVPRAILGNPDPTNQDLILKNITRNGITSPTLNYLRLCVILEPMQQLMSQQKQFPNIAPRDCLRTTLFQRFNAQKRHAQSHMGAGHTPLPHPMVPPINDDPPKAPSKRKRSRKGSQGGTSGQSGGASSRAKKNATASPAPVISTFALTSNVDVMVVDEPSMMGGEYGEEDERLISRLENTQYDPTVVRSSGIGPSVPFDAAAATVWTGGPPPPPQSLLLPSRPSSSGTPGSRIGTPSGIGHPGSTPLEQLAQSQHHHQQLTKTAIATSDANCNPLLDPPVSNASQ